MLMYYSNKINWVIICFVLCLTLGFGKMRAFSQSQARLLVINPDKRGYVIKGEMLTLHFSFFRAKQAYFTGIKINGRRTSLNTYGFPIKKYTHRQKITQVGNIDVPIRIKYIYKGAERIFNRIYTIKASHHDSTNIRNIYLHHAHMVPAYKNSRGEPMKVHFKGDTKDLEVHQNAGTLYVTSQKVKVSTLEVFYQGKKMDQRTFKTIAYPPPKVTPFYSVKNGSSLMERLVHPNLIAGLILKPSWPWLREISSKLMQYRIISYKVFQHRKGKLISQKVINKPTFRMTNHFKFQQGDQITITVLKAVRIVNDNTQISISTKGLQFSFKTRG